MHCLFMERTVYAYDDEYIGGVIDFLRHLEGRHGAVHLCLDALCDLCPFTGRLLVMEVNARRPRAVVVRNPIHYAACGSSPLRLLPSKPIHLLR
jgi:hypothetical protein